MSVIIDVELRARVLRLLNDGMPRDAEQISESLSMSKDYSDPRGGRRYWKLIGLLDQMADLELTKRCVGGTIVYSINSRWEALCGDV